MACETGTPHQSGQSSPQLAHVFIGRLPVGILELQEVLDAYILAYIAYSNV